MNFVSYLCIFLHADSNSHVTISNSSKHFRIS